MDYRIVTIIHILGFYSLAFIVATTFYLLKGYPSETPFLPFVEGISVMAVFSLYVLFGLVAGKIKNTFFKILLWIYIVVIILLGVFSPNSVLMIGGFIFAFPAVPIGWLTLFGPHTTPVVLIQVVVAVTLLLLSCKVQSRKKPVK